MLGMCISNGVIHILHINIQIAQEFDIQSGGLLFRLPYGVGVRILPYFQEEMMTQETPIELEKMMA